MPSIVVFFAVFVFRRGRRRLVGGFNWAGGGIGSEGVAVAIVVVVILLLIAAAADHVTVAIVDAAPLVGATASVVVIVVAMHMHGRGKVHCPARLAAVAALAAGVVVPSGDVGGALHGWLAGWNGMECDDRQIKMQNRTPRDDNRIMCYWKTEPGWSRAREGTWE